eukprot:jgi/Mesvir1/19650/Mv09932-RA.1
MPSMSLAFGSLQPSITSIHRSNYRLQCRSCVRHSQKTMDAGNTIYKGKEFDAKMKKLMEAGISKLQIIADFDATLTTYNRRDGTKNASCHAVFEQYRGFPDAYRGKAQALFEHYHEIEMSDMPDDQKAPLMVEWWTKAHDLILAYGVQRSWVTDMVQQTPLDLRDGCKELLGLLDKWGVPVLVLSAGIANVIHEVLRQHQLLFPSTHIISNEMIFDPDTGALLRFGNNLVHCLNKSEHAAEGLPYFDSIKAHRAAILLGDQVSDLQMAQGADLDVLLTVGFLNGPPSRVEKQLTNYRDAFDVVLLGDGGLEFVNDVVKQIIAASPA